MTDERSDERAYGGPERRTALRVAARARGQAQGELALDLESEVQMLSPGGMMIRVPFPLEVGSRQRFTLAVEEAVFEVEGEVRTCQPVEGHAPGWGAGVEFRDLGEREREMIERFVRARLASPNS